MSNVTEIEHKLRRHEVTAWTAGELRQALDGVPDNMPVVLSTSPPFYKWADPDHVITWAGPWTDSGAEPTQDAPADRFHIDGERPSGEYYEMINNSTGEILTMSIHPRLRQLRSDIDAAGESGLSRRAISRGVAKELLDELLAQLTADGQYERAYVTASGRRALKYRRAAT
jgi:hypothetical protein